MPLNLWMTGLKIAKPFAALILTLSISGNCGETVHAQDSAAGSTAESQTPAAVISEITRPPEGSGVPEFYTKYITVDGYPICASSQVNDYAVKEAAWLVSQMLAHRPMSVMP